MSFAIVVIINKAFKLFKLVLVVYCDSCCHWWYPENSGNQKNVYNAKKPLQTPSTVSTRSTYFESWINTQYNWLQNNIAQLYFILRTAKLCWNFSSLLWDVWYLQISNSAHGWNPLPDGKSVNIRGILRYTGKIPM